MLASIVEQIGPWTWWVVGLALLAAEIVLPGVFLMWIGIAAIVVGAVSLALWGDAAWTWQVQIIVFAVLAVLSALIGRRVMSRQQDRTDQPLLNQRGASLIGRTATLVQPINEGRGRVRLDDTTWIVSGPDLPVGARVRVVSSSGGTLHVEEVAAPE
jgi:membrane protein implicated in regulation of membrane protease activity